jgi:3-oxoacyl-[acyl-carrier protein] reductase
MVDKRLAIVTGGAQGIGRAITFALLNQGRRVAVFDIKEEQLADLQTKAAEARYSGEDLLCRKLDITNSAALAETIEELGEKYGGVAILVNNAGITRDKLMIQMDDSDYDLLMNINLKAAFTATRLVARSMMRKKFGRIVSISSVAGVMGQAGSTNYAASKAGLIGMTKSVAREIGKKGVTANCVAPGFIQTEMTDILPEMVKKAALEVIPVKRMGQPEDVAAAVAFLCSDEAGYITGQVLCVDGGMAM